MKTNGKKRIGLLLLGLLCITLVPAQKRQVMLDRVVAVVGNSSILYSDVSDYAASLVAQRRQAGYTSDRDPMNEALEALLTQKLLYNQAQIDSVTVNDSDISSRVEAQIQEWSNQEGGILQLEAKHHMPVYNIRENLRQRYLEHSYANAMQSQVVEKVTVTPGEVERFYKRLPKDSLPPIAEQYVYAQITRFPKTMVEAKQRTREQLLELRERIITGKARFETMARMYGQDGTAMRGGEMDPATLNQLDPAFGEALQRLTPGQISEIVESQFGFHIIQLIDKKGEYYHFRHILMLPIYTTAELAGVARELDSIANLIRQDSLTFEEAAMRFSDDASSKMNGGIVSNHAYLERTYADARMMETKFLHEDFATFDALDDYNALRTLKQGEISASFLTHDLIGNQLGKIVKLVEVIPTHPASLENDYLRIEEMALQEKKMRTFEEWLTQKIDRMYVYIDPEFRHGEFENKHWVK